MLSESVFVCRHVLNARTEWCEQHPVRGGCAKNGGLIWLRPLGEFTQRGQWCKSETFSVFMFPFQAAKAFLFRSLLFYFNPTGWAGLPFRRHHICVGRYGPRRVLLCERHGNVSPVILNIFVCSMLILMSLQGDLCGRRGLVPSNFLQPLPWN